MGLWILRMQIYYICGKINIPTGETGLVYSGYIHGEYVAIKTSKGTGIANIQTSFIISTL